MATDSNLLRQANFNQIIIDAVASCESCCLDDKEDRERVAHTVLEGLRSSATYEAFVEWRSDYDCDFLLNSYDAALAWLCGRGFFEEEHEVAAQFREWEDGRESLYRDSPE